MVFRGKPSRSCERCRLRRAKCDLRSGACGQCVRASAHCSGYRDSEQLRFQDESLSVAQKALRNTNNNRIQYLPLSIDLQARAVFFNYYVVFKCWKVLLPYQHPADSPEHLTSAIEAVSLAFVWFKAQSDVALVTARERYSSALCGLRTALQCPREAVKESTLLTPLLLDLFEKFTDSEPRSNLAWKSHVDGALALVHHRGVEQFRSSHELNILILLSGNYLVDCVADSSTIPAGLRKIQDYISATLDNNDPGIRLSSLMARYANLNSRARSCSFPDHELKSLALNLDHEFQSEEASFPLRWQYSTIFLHQKSDRAYDLYLHAYAVAKACQVRNLLRVVRIFLNESLIEYESASSKGSKASPLLLQAQDNVSQLAAEICASVPQYVDCNHATRENLPLAVSKSTLHSDHQNAHDHHLDVYALIFPLYVAGISNPVSGMREWIIKQLYYIANHFTIRHAQVVAQILERGTIVDPWEAYTMLGSYASQA